MEIRILEEGKNRVIIEIEGESHAFCNALKKELWNDKHVKAAAYNVEHPLITKPKIIVETDGNEKPIKALEKAASRLGEQLKKFKTSFGKEVK